MEMKIVAYTNTKVYIPNDMDMVYYLLTEVNGKSTFVECKIKEIRIPIVNDEMQNRFISPKTILETPIGEKIVGDDLCETIFTEPKFIKYSENHRNLSEYGWFKSYKDLFMESNIKNPFMVEKLALGYYLRICYYWDGVKAVAKYRETEKNYFSYNGHLNDFVKPLKDGEYETKEECEKANSVNVIRFNETPKSEPKNLYKISFGEEGVANVDEETYKKIKEMLKR